MRYPPLPGPATPLFGLRLARRLWQEPLAFATDLADHYGDLAGFRLGPYRACAVNNPALIREVLVNKARSFRKLPRIMQVLRQLDGEGLVIREGSSWLRRRQLLQSAFSARRLEHGAAVVVSVTRRLVAGWSEGMVLDVADVMMRLTLEVLLRALFDAELSPPQVTSACEAVGLLSEVLMREMGESLPRPSWLPLRGQHGKHAALELLKGLSRDVVGRRRPGEGGGGGLLALLLADGDQAAAQTREEVLALLHAGHETTAAGLAWTWYLLARHPEVQEQVAREVETVLGERPATNEDLPRLACTGRVVQESLRLYTPTWTLFPRQALQDVDIGGYRLARGSWVFIYPYALHRNPRWFAHPGDFDPERFAPGRREQVPPGAYLPFGAGGHRCLGGRFASMTMTLVVASVLQQFRLQLAPGQGVPQPEPFLALRPRGGVRMTLVSRRAQEALRRSGREDMPPV